MRVEVGARALRQLAACNLVLVLMLVVVLVAMLVVVVSERHIVQDSLIFIDTEKRRDVILSLAAAFFPLLI